MPRILDRFAGRSTLCDGRRSLPVRAGAEEAVLIASLSVRLRLRLRPARSRSVAVPFYVPLGPRGLVLHFGGLITRGSARWYTGRRAVDGSPWPRCVVGRDPLIR